MLDTRELERIIRAEGTAAAIINTRSRQGELMSARALAALRQAGLQVIRSHIVRNPEYLHVKVRQALDEGQRLILVGGGDGSISSVVGDFAYRDVALGILPLGTGNSFARSLGVPLTLNGAVDVILHGRVCDVDLGRVDETYFANIADIGLTAEMAWSTPDAWKRRLGKLAYVVMGARLLLRYRPFRCRLCVEGQADIELLTHEIIVANGRYYGDTVLDTGATVRDAHLTVLAMHAVNRWQLARLWLAFLARRTMALTCARCLAVTAVALDTDPPQYIDLDGEATIRTPAVFRVAPRALRVLVPREW